MLRIKWNINKNQELMRTRGVSFDDVYRELRARRILDDTEHPNRNSYPHQRILVVKIRDYAYVVPYFYDEDTVFLKTIIPSRKATRKYLGGER